MSKTNNTRRANIRWQLLVSASISALLASAYTAGEARAADSDRPTLWIELGGQLSRLGDDQEAFDPAFVSSIAHPNLLSALNVQSQPAYGLDEEGKISFQPDGSDWVFSAAISYGRAGTARHVHAQTKNSFIHLDFALPPSFGGAAYDKYYYPNRFVRFADGKSSQSKRHLILDFTAGKDVGLGLFGANSTSVISAGVRIAQFTSKSTTHLSAIPDLQYRTAPITSVYNFLDFKYNAGAHFHHYTASATIQRSFKGVGPSLTWNNSVPFAGNPDGTELTLDWGVNAAVLFGKQRTQGRHATTVKSYDLVGFHNGQGTYANADLVYFGGAGVPHPTHVSNRPANISRERSVTVPNLGGFAGISFRYADAKVSFGYRADYFFGAIDGGIDTRKEENRNFYGPYASISIGLGD